MKKLIPWIVLLIPMVCEAATPPTPAVIINGPESRLQYYPRLSSTTIGMLGTGIIVYNGASLLGPASWFIFSGAGCTPAVSGGSLTITCNGGGGSSGGGSTKLGTKIGNLVLVSSGFFPEMTVVSDGNGASTFTFTNTTNSWTASQNFKATTTFDGAIFITTGVTITNGNLVVGTQAPAGIVVSISSSAGYLGEIVRMSTGETVLADFTASSATLNFPRGVGISSLTVRGNITAGNSGKYFGTPFNDLTNCLYCFDTGSTGFNAFGGNGQVSFISGGAIHYGFTNGAFIVNGTNIVRGPNGSQAAPTYTFTNKLTSGLLLDAGNADIAMSANSKELMRWMSAGSVIIGRSGIGGATFQVSSGAVNQPLVLFTSEVPKFQVDGSSIWANAPIYASSPIIVTTLTATVGMLTPSVTTQVLTVSGSSVTTQNYTLVLASPPVQGQHFFAAYVNGTNVVMAGGGDNAGSGGGSGSDGFGNPVSTRVVSAPFGINSSSGIFTSSMNVYDVITSSTGALLGGATIQGNGLFINPGFLAVGTSNYWPVTFSSANPQSYIFGITSGVMSNGDPLFGVGVSSTLIGSASTYINGVAIIGPLGGGTNTFIGELNVVSGGDGRIGGGFQASTVTAQNLLISGGKNTSLDLNRYIVLVTTQPNTYAVAVTSTNHFAVGGGSPVVTSCGSSPSGAMLNSTDNSGTIQVGGTVPTACTVTFQTPYKNIPYNPACVVSDNSITVAPSIDTANSNNTKMVINFSAALGGGIVTYFCTGVRE